MSHSLIQLMAERISAGLNRKTLTMCSKWAEKYRYMPPIKNVETEGGAWSFKYFPWLREMHDSLAPENVGQKSSQAGFTEAALNISFFNIDVKTTSVLYVLPAMVPDARDFTASRFNPAIESSPHLEQIFSDVKNLGHKRAGNVNLYIRGSRSRTGLKSIPVGCVILDEADEMFQDNIPLAMERMAGQKLKTSWIFSTPTHPGTGVNQFFRTSSQEHFFFQCPSCSQMTELIFPECVEICGDSAIDPRIKQSYYKCKECKKKLNHETKCDWLTNNEWVPQNKGSEDRRGFHINQLYSSMVSAPELVKLYLESHENPAKEQNFYNSNLGMEHVVDGAQITDEDIDQCMGSYKSADIKKTNRIITMGIDVGKFCHFEIDEWILGPAVGHDVNTTAICKVLHFGKVPNFEDLDKLILQYSVRGVVIDALPERRMALQFANRFPGLIRTCFYTRGIAGKEINESSAENYRIDVDRTAWLDLSLSRFKNETIQLPRDISPEYRLHLKAPIRLYRPDEMGGFTAYYDSGVIPDHFAHARNYAEIALPFAMRMGSNRDLRQKVS